MIVPVVDHCQKPCNPFDGIFGYHSFGQKRPIAAAAGRRQMELIRLIPFQNGWPTAERMCVPQVVQMDCKRLAIG